MILKKSNHLFLKHKHLSLVMLVFFLVSCIDTTVSIRVNENGKASVTIIYKASSEYALFILPDLKEQLIQEGYTILDSHYDTVKGIIYTDIKHVFFEGSVNLGKGKNIKDKKGNKIVKGLIKKKILIDYKIPKDEKIFEDDPDAYFAEQMLSSARINYVITVPGKIVETTGKIVSDNTVKWSSSFLDLFKRGKHIYIKSEINRSPINQFSAQKKAEGKIMKYYSQMDEIGFKIAKKKKMIASQKKVNKKILLEKNKSDQLLIKSLNL